MPSPRRLRKRQVRPFKPIRLFDPKEFLANAGIGRTIHQYGRTQAIFSQGKPADAVYYIQEGRVRLSVVSKQGKEATIALLGPGDFLGEGCIASDQSVRMATATAITECAVPATRFDLDRWLKTLPQPWSAAIEATMFTGWIYDHLKPHAAALKVAHPLMLRAIAAAKKKNDRIDANKICDCLRCDFLPECYMASTAIRERRRTLRYRNLLVRQMVQMKIKISTLLMEAGVSYNKQRLHKAGYFRELLATNPHIDEGLRSLLRQCREMVVRQGKTENALIRSLQNNRFLAERVERLMSIPAVGPITALTWALEIGEVQRFSSIKKAVSYCGLCGDQQSSADHVQRTPLSKQRNKHLQTTLIEAAKMAPRYSPTLALLYDREKRRGNANRATLAVARKLVAYLMAVEVLRLAGKHKLNAGGNDWHHPLTREFLHEQIQEARSH